MVNHKEMIQEALFFPKVVKYSLLCFFSVDSVFIPSIFISKSPFYI